MLFSFLTHPFPHPLPYPAETWRLHFSCEIFPSQLNFWILMTEKSCQGKHPKHTPTHFTTFESVSLTNAHKKKKKQKEQEQEEPKTTTTWGTYNSFPWEVGQIFLVWQKVVALVVSWLFWQQLCCWQFHLSVSVSSRIALLSCTCLGPSLSFVPTYLPWTKAKLVQINLSVTCKRTLTQSKVFFAPCHCTCPCFCRRRPAFHSFSFRSPEIFHQRFLVFLWSALELSAWHDNNVHGREINLG